MRRELLQLSVVNFPGESRAIFYRRAADSVQSLTPLTPDASCYSPGHRIQPQIFLTKLRRCIERLLERS
jgi:hypothetical protein